MLEQKKGKITRFCRWLPASTKGIYLVTMSGAGVFSDDALCPLQGRRLQRTQNHTPVTLVQKQQVFDAYVNTPIHEY